MFAIEDLCNKLNAFCTGHKYRHGQQPIRTQKNDAKLCWKILRNCKTVKGEL